MSKKKKEQAPDPVTEALGGAAPLEAPAVAPEAPPEPQAPSPVVGAPANIDAAVSALADAVADASAAPPVEAAPEGAELAALMNHGVDPATTPQPGRPRKYANREEYLKADNERRKAARDAKKRGGAPPPRNVNPSTAANAGAVSAGAAVYATREELQRENDRLRAENGRLKTAQDAQGMKELGGILAMIAGVASRIVASRRGKHWNLSDGEAKDIGNAWAPVLAPYMADLAAYIPLAAAAAVTYNVLESRIAVDNGELTLEQWTEGRRADAMRGSAPPIATVPPPIG